MEPLPDHIAPRPAAAQGWLDAQGVRYLVAVGAVALWVAIGIGLHLNANIYLLLTIPFGAAFQLLIQRKPLREAWVRGSPPLRFDAITACVSVVLAIVPAYSVVAALWPRYAVVSAASAGAWPNMLYDVAAVGGAFGAAYALRSSRRAIGWMLPLCVLIAAGIGVGLTTLDGLLSHTLHLYAPGPGAATAAYYFLLYLPAVFVMEEVFFRGVLDTFLHERETGTGWLSAVVVSSLWGLWHLPVVMGRGSIIVLTLALLIVMVPMGVTLSIFWRKSGNLLVPGAAHAVNDAIRNVLVGIP